MAPTCRSAFAAHRILHVALLLCAVVSCGCLSRHPSSRELLTRFHEHWADFEKLREMFLHDRDLERVAADFTRPEDPSSVGVTPERLRAYRELFKRLGLEAGIEGYGKKEELFFIASTSDLAISGSAKGFAYVSGDPGEVVEDLDTYRNEKSFTVYQHIEGNCYLYLDHEE